MPISPVGLRAYLRTGKKKLREVLSIVLFMHTTTVHIYTLVVPAPPKRNNEVVGLFLFCLLKKTKTTTSTWYDFEV